MQINMYIASLLCVLALFSTQQTAAETYHFAPDLSPAIIARTIASVKEFPVDDFDIMTFGDVSRTDIKHAINTKKYDDGWTPLSKEARASILTSSHARRFEFGVCESYLSYIKDMSIHAVFSLSKNPKIIQLDLLVGAALLQQAVAKAYRVRDPIEQAHDLALEKFLITPLQYALKTGVDDLLPTRNNGRASNVILINDHLHRLYVQKKLSVPHFVSVASGCGAEEILVKFSAPAKIETLSVTSDYLFNLCLADKPNANPWDPRSCDYWYSIGTEEYNLSGTVRYRAKLADKSEVCHKMEIGKPNSKDQTVRITLGGPQCPK